MYVPRNNWVICERTGMKFRKSEMRQEWNGLYVNKASWESRHPQDFVKVDAEDTTASLVLPDNPQVLGQTTLSHNLWLNNTNWTKLVTTATIEENDAIGIVLNNNAEFWTFAESVTAITNGPLIDVNNTLVFDSNGVIIYTADPYSGYEVTLATRIWSNADYGNTVHLPALNEEAWR